MNVDRRTSTVNGERAARMPAKDQARIMSQFGAAVNMTADELEAWLETDDNRAVGWKGADGRQYAARIHQVIADKNQTKK
jgi:hypothetical protein